MEDKERWVFGKESIKDPTLYILIAGFCIPFIFQIGLFPFQKLSMFSEDPSAYKKWNKAFLEFKN
jgi:hypothetical protein